VTVIGDHVNARWTWAFVHLHELHMILTYYLLHGAGYSLKSW